MKKDNNEIKKVYYENEKLAEETPFVNGKKHGVEKRYYESGELLGEIHYENDRRHGVEKRYYKSGELEIEIKFKNDIAISGAFYFQDGTKKEFTKDLLYSLTELVHKE